MEFHLILLHHDGVRREYVSWRGTDLPDMTRLQDFTELFVNRIYERIAEEKVIHPAGWYEPIITTPTAYGAEIRVVIDAFAAIADEFNALGQECRKDF